MTEQQTSAAPEPEYQNREPDPPENPNRLNLSMERANSSQEDDTSFHLNRRRTVVSVSAEALTELELQDAELARRRDVMADRATRAIAAVNDIDSARRDLQLSITAIRSRFQGSRP